MLHRLVQMVCDPRFWCGVGMLISGVCMNRLDDVDTRWECDGLLLVSHGSSNMR